MLESTTGDETSNFAKFHLKKKSSRLLKLLDFEMCSVITFQSSLEGYRNEKSSARLKMIMQVSSWRLIKHCTKINNILFTHPKDSLWREIYSTKQGGW